MLWWIITALAAVGIDQLTKRLTVEYLKPIGSVPLIQDVLHLTYVENTGAAFGMLKNSRWLFMTVSTVAIIGMIIFMFIQGKKIKPLGAVAMGMIIGGGIGNMIDRIVSGFVVDFIDFTLIDFAVFNGADSFVCIGAGLMFIYVLIFERDDGKKIAGKAEKESADV